MSENKKGTKHSAKRDELYRLICSTKTHPNAEWIYNQAKPAIPDLSLATVYRNLALFRSQGLIDCVATVKGQERYDANTVPHTHFICELCGAVTDIETASLSPDIVRRVEEEYPLEISSVSLNFSGTCRECLENDC